MSAEAAAEIFAALAKSRAEWEARQWRIPEPPPWLLPVMTPIGIVSAIAYVWLKLHG